ncbi:conserved membrane protein of unknown function [Nitrospira sp. KM1]|nr:conserved membrane protein of unknown function [Nitrospira sp. KM1]
MVPRYDGPAILSYGFRPFFLSAALFAGVAIPIWVVLFTSGVTLELLYGSREWHVHEMLFGFLPAVIAGFLLTAVPNWTGRAPLRGVPLLLLWLLWLAGRICLALSGMAPLVAACIDSAFLIVLASLVWRELAVSGSWGQAPIGMLITLYAITNVQFHVGAMRGAPTEFSERIAVSLVMLLLTLIGGRITPNFTREFMIQTEGARLPPEFSWFDGLAILFVLVASFTWIMSPDSAVSGWLFIMAGVTNLARLWRWRGWMVRSEPLVMILHAGYGWLVLSLLALGAALLGAGLSQVNAVHALTAGAVGTMTLAVMTRASLGHTGRPKRAGGPTIVIYVLVSIGALLRVLAPDGDGSAPFTHLMLALSAFAWSGAYAVFSAVYGPWLVKPGVDELNA